MLQGEFNSKIISTFFRTQNSKEKLNFNRKEESKNY